MEWVIGVLTVVGLIVVFLVESIAYGGVGTWLELRSATSADEVLDQIEEYGPQAPGLRLDLLSQEQRQAVLADRAHLEEKRASRRVSSR
jgi:hypothetical protein